MTGGANRRGMRDCLVHASRRLIFGFLEERSIATGCRSGCIIGGIGRGGKTWFKVDVDMTIGDGTKYEE